MRGPPPPSAAAAGGKPPAGREGKRRSAAARPALAGGALKAVAATALNAASCASPERPQHGACTPARPLPDGAAAAVATNSSQLPAKRQRNPSAKAMNKVGVNPAGRCRSLPA